MSSGSDSLNAREEAIAEFRESAGPARWDRHFSGERIKRAVTGDRLTKAAFVIGTGAVLFLVFNHDSKEQRALSREARAAMQLEEPSVRDFRPPVMPSRLLAAEQPVTAPPTPKPEQPKQTAIEDGDAIAKRRKAEQLEDARTKSDIVVKGATSASPAVAHVAAAQPGFPLMPPELAPRSARIPESPAEPNTAFSRQVSGRAVPTSLPHKRGQLGCFALQGKFIDAELETAINTDLPGQIRAIVSAPLYGEQGRQVLLASGSRLIGTYNSTVQKGQVRVFAIWNRAIRPDGVEIVLDSHASDALGRSGIVGETDNHFLQVFGTSVLLSIIGAGTSVVGVSSDDRYNAADEYRRQVQQSFGRTADQVLAPYGRIAPTNTVRQGERVKVFLNRDLDFCSLNVASRDAGELVLP